MARDIRKLQERAGNLGHGFLAYMLAMAGDEADAIARPAPTAVPFKR
jgi:hypothetical protein